MIKNISQKREKVSHAILEHRLFIYILIYQGFVLKVPDDFLAYFRYFAYKYIQHGVAYIIIFVILILQVVYQNT